MRLVNDDLTQRVDSHWLGPKGWTFWWQARYIAYGVGLGMFVLASMVESKVGVHRSFWTFVFTLCGVVLATRAVGRRINQETRFRDVALIAWHEITAPRENRKPRTVTFDMTKVKIK